MKQSVVSFIKQFLRFSAVGITAFCIDYALFLLLTYLFGVYYIVASTLSYCISTVYNYAMSMRYVFQGKETQTAMQQFFIFFGLSLVGLGLNQLFLWLFVAYATIPKWFGKLLATLLVSVYNFFSRKLCLENHPNHRQRRAG